MSGGRRISATWIAFAIASALSTAEAGDSVSQGVNALLNEAIETYSTAMETEDRNLRLEQFRSAERFFHAAIEAGANNADIWTNQGNAALQAERLGPAILAYRRALQLDPNLDRSRQNLAYARGQLPDRIPTPPPIDTLGSIFDLRAHLSFIQRMEAMAILFAGASVLLSLSILYQRRALRSLGVVFFALWGAALASEILGNRSSAHSEAVVIVAEATTRAADSINAPLRFREPLPSGTEVKIIEDRSGWLHIELYNGRDAWLTEGALARISPNQK